MHTCIIIEDEPQAIKLIEHFISKVKDLELLATFRNPSKGLKFLDEQSVDLIFLDINMPELSGLELLEKLTDPPAVIFTTAYLEYAHHAFEIDAVDYLVKPISQERFSEAYRRFVDRRMTPQEPKPKLTSSSKDSIFIKSGTSIHQLDWKEILYINRDENYVCFHLPDRKILSRRSIGSLEPHFPDYFHRVHKSYAVSTLHVDRIMTQQVEIRDQLIPIGRSYREGFLKEIAEI